MADGIEAFDEKRNLDRVKAGMRGGSWFTNGAEAPKRTFADGHPPGVAQMMGSMPAPKLNPIDTWFSRK